MKFAPLLAQLSILAATVLASTAAFQPPTSQAFLSFHLVSWSSPPSPISHSHEGATEMTRSAREIRRRSLNEPCTSGRLREVLEQSIVGGPTRALLSIVSRLRGCPLSAVCTNDATTPELFERRHYCRLTRVGSTCSVSTGPLRAYDPHPRKRHSGHVSHPKNRSTPKQDDDDLDMILATLSPLPTRTFRPNIIVDEFAKNTYLSGNDSEKH